MSIRNKATEDQKNKLRKIKTLPDSVKNIIYSGNRGGPSVTVQFNRDLNIYGLWEALLYTEINNRFFDEDTMEKALNAALESIK